MTPAKEEIGIRVLKAKGEENAGDKGDGTGAGTWKEERKGNGGAAEVVGGEREGGHGSFGGWKVHKMSP